MFEFWVSCILWRHDQARSPQKVVNSEKTPLFQGNCVHECYTAKPQAHKHTLKGVVFIFLILNYHDLQRNGFLFKFQNAWFERWFLFKRPNLLLSISWPPCWGSLAHSKKYFCLLWHWSNWRSAIFACCKGGVKLICGESLLTTPIPACCKFGASMIRHFGSDGTRRSAGMLPGAVEFDVEVCGRQHHWTGTPNELFVVGQPGNQPR